MLGLAAYRLEVCQIEGGTSYEFFDPESGRLVGAALSAAQAGGAGGPGRTAGPSRWFAMLGALAMLPILLIRAIAGHPHPAPGGYRGPRLVVRRPDDDEAVLTIRQSSGMFYDSRVACDGRGRAIAQFRGPSKIPLGRMGFGMIDLGGRAEGSGDYGLLPWLGRVEPAGDGAYRFSLVGDAHAGRVIERRDPRDPHGADPEGSGHARYDIEVGPGLRGNPAGQALLLAAALALAWRPQPG